MDRSQGSGLDAAVFARQPGRPAKNDTIASFKKTQQDSVVLNDANRDTNRAQTATQTASINKLNKTKLNNINNINNEIPAGGVCINNTIIHIVNHRLPFGGRGSSGIGYYHGENSFDAFSHQKAVTSSSLKFDFKMKYPPYDHKHEKFKKSHFEGDFKKLVKDIINPNSRAFFVIAGALNKFNDKEVANFDFLNGKKLKKKSWTNYEINDNGKKVHIKIRPSHAESQGKSRLWSWEIMGKSIVSQ